MIELRGLSKTFGGARALDGVDLTIRAGEVHGLLGENGSGKSTLIKILAGFHAPDEGELEVNGEPVKLPLRRAVPRARAQLRPPGPRAGPRAERAREPAHRRARAVALAGGSPGAPSARARARLSTRYGVELDPRRARRRHQPDRARAARDRARDRGDPARPPARTAGACSSSTSRRSSCRARASSGSSRSCATIVDASTRACSSSRTTSTRCARSPTASPCCATAACVGTVVTAETSEGAARRDDHRPPPRAARARPRTTRSGTRVGVAVDGPARAQASRTSRSTCTRARSSALTGLIGSGFDEVPYLLFGARPARDGELRIGEATYYAAVDDAAARARRPASR